MQKTTPSNFPAVQRDLLLFLQIEKLKRSRHHHTCDKAADYYYYYFFIFIFLNGDSEFVLNQPQRLYFVALTPRA